MEIRYTIDINAPRAHVWRCMLSHGTYEKWAAPFMSGSTFRGEFETGSEVDFYVEGIGGTRVRLRAIDAPSLMDAEHVAVLGGDLQMDPDSEFAQQWIGSTETYRLHDNAGGGTRLDVLIATDDALHGQFEDTWTKALSMLKAVAEDS